MERKSRAEIESTKEWLWSYRRLIKEIASKRLELTEIRESLSSARALVYDDMPHGSGSLTDLSNAMVQLEEREEELADKLQEAADTQRRILSEIKRLPRITSNIFFERYIRGNDWVDIAEEHEMSLSAVHRKHRDGLNQIKVQD